MQHHRHANKAEESPRANFSAGQHGRSTKVEDVSLRFLHGPYVPCLLGFSLVLAFTTMFMGRTAPGILGLGASTIYLYYGVSIVALAAIAALSRRGLSIKSHTPAVMGATVVCVAGTALVMVSNAYTQADISSLLFFLGTPLSAAGITVVTLAWYELLAGFSIDYAMLYYVASGLIAATMRLVWFLAAPLPAPLAEIIICLMPVAALALFEVGKRKVQGLPYTGAERVQPHWEFPWMPVLLLGIFSLTSKFVLNLLVETDKGYTSIAGVICYGILFAIVVLGFKRFPYQLIRYAALPLMLMGMLCQINGPHLSIPGMVLTRIAQDTLLVFVVSLLFNLSYRRGVNALWVFGLTLACGNAGQLAANLLSVEFADSLADKDVQTLAISALVVVATMAFVALTPEKSLTGGWGIEPSDGVGERQSAPEADLIETCSRTARRYDLTRREEDVLLMRLQGAALKDVEESLCISHNTVKSHVRHIYAKLGVSNLEEAHEIVCRQR